MKNILICSNAMGIGGVETVILNQIVSFVKKGYKVYVTAKSGAYSKKVNELGGTFIEFEFPEENQINKERVNKLVKIIKEKQITEIHNHKYQCIPTVLTACFITNIPYFTYEHGIKDSKPFYTWNYPIYKELFPIYFKNAYKIIAITPMVADVTKKEYKFSEDKYKIIHNGIDFNEFNNETPNYNNKIEKVFIVTRIDKEKVNPIYNGIKIFKKLLEKFPSAKLYIIGDGNAKNEIIEYLNKENLPNSYKSEKETTVNLLGAKSNIKDYLKTADLLLGIGRCALEAVAMKVPVIITGYEGIKGLITPKNMEIAIEENFLGINMPTISDEQCIKEIENLKENKKDILETVYSYSKDKLDCYKNYINIPEEVELQVDWFQILNIIEKNRNTIEEQSKDIKAKYEIIQKKYEETESLTLEKQQIEEEKLKIEKQLQEKNEKLEEELKNVYNSKRWRYTEKISKIFKKNSN